MSIETTLYSTLANDSGVSAIVSDRIYPSIAPPDASKPMVVYFVVAGTRLDGLSGVGGAIRKRIQLNCFADTYPGSIALADAVVAALSGNGFLELEIDLYDPETETHNRIIDWSFMTV